MDISVKLFATLREGRFVTSELSVPEGVRIEDLLPSMDIQAAQVGISLINGRQVFLEEILSEKDILCLFPRIGGG